MKRLYLNSKLFNGSEEEFIEIKDFDSKVWKLNGMTHRIDGPAVMERYGINYWYIENKNPILYFSMYFPIKIFRVNYPGLYIDSTEEKHD